MAGSYAHVIDDQGRLVDSETMAGMLENGGDVYEAVEEMYGMIWFLAHQMEQAAIGISESLLHKPLPEGWSVSAFVETARKRYPEGLAASPGLVSEN